MNRRGRRNLATLLAIVALAYWTAVEAVRARTTRDSNALFFWWITAPIVTILLLSVALALMIGSLPR